MGLIRFINKHQYTRKLHIMELPHIGTHCHLKSCNKLDYLPFKCNKCQLSFCESHHEPKLHSCSSLATEEKESHQPQKIKPKKKKKSNPCQMPECRGFNLVPMTCRDCGLNFCMKHRFAVDHACLGRMTSRASRLIACN